MPHSSKITVSLYYVSLIGWCTAIGYLIDQGADVNGFGGDKGTALGAAVWEGHLEAIELFLKKGADINLNGHWLLWTSSPNSGLPWPVRYCPVIATGKG